MSPPSSASFAELIGPLHNVAAAEAAQYTDAIPGCFVDAKLGGMGFHFAKGSTIDGHLNELEPEVLVYEPEKDGRLQLVAVEFIIPFQIAPENGPAPTLFNGRAFTPFDANGRLGASRVDLQEQSERHVRGLESDRELRRRTGLGAHVALRLGVRVQGNHSVARQRNDSLGL